MVKLGEHTAYIVCASKLNTVYGKCTIKLNT